MSEIIDETAKKYEDSARPRGVDVMTQPAKIQKKRGRKPDDSVEANERRREKWRENTNKYNAMKREKNKKLLNEFIEACKEKKDMSKVYTLAEEILTKNLMRVEELFFHINWNPT